MRDNSNFKKALIAKSFSIARKTIALVDKFPKKKASDVIANQLLRAATSIGANIIEAQSGSSKRDFVNFLTHALKSGNETKFWLALAKELDKNIGEDLENIFSETNELVKILGASIATIRGKRAV